MNKPAVFCWSIFAASMGTLIGYAASWLIPPGWAALAGAVVCVVLVVIAALCLMAGAVDRREEREQVERIRGGLEGK